MLNHFGKLACAMALTVAVSLSTPILAANKTEAVVKAETKATQQTLAKKSEAKKQIKRRSKKISKSSDGVVIGK